jgi:uncharacterized protein (TIGR03083 family)
MHALEPVRVLDLFPEVRQRGIEMLSGLSEEQWNAPTVAAGWSVKDIALHLLGGTIANISRRRDGFVGNFGAFVPDGGSLDDYTALVETLNAWNETWVLAARRLSPRLLCELLAVTGEALEAYFRELDLMAMGDAIGWAGPDAAPVWLDVAREYTEQWTHQAQIRDAVGAPALDEPYLFAPVLATFMHALPHTIRDVVRPEGTRLRVTVTGPAGGAWVVERLADRWAFTEPSGSACDVRLTMDQDVAWRLVTKGLTVVEARSLVDIDGDPELAAAALEMVAIIA